MKNIKKIIPYLIIIVTVVLIRTFFVTPVAVQGKSMYPNLEPKQILILEKINKNFKRFDVVVLKIGNDKLVKRIIALPGEHIKYVDDKLYINQKIVKENFVKNTKTDDFDLTEFGYDKLPKNTYFVMGDNRGNSLDSRVFGPVEKKDFIGKTIFSIFPIRRIGTIKK